MRKTNAPVLFLVGYPTIGDSKRQAKFNSDMYFTIRQKMRDAGFSPADVEYAYIFPDTYPPKNDLASWKGTKTSGFPAYGDGYWDPTVVARLEEIKAELQARPPELIIAAGDLPLLALSGSSSSTVWRGSQLFFSSTRVVSTVSPVLCNQMYEWYYPFQADLNRAYRFWSEKQTEPAVDFTINPTATQVLAFLASIPDGATIGVDIETRLKAITYLSIATSPTRAISIPFLKADKESHYWTEQEELTITCALKRKLEACELVGQNFSYDLQYLARYWGFSPRLPWQDTMIWWHTYQAGMKKSLDFISSLNLPYYSFWKEEGKKHDPSPDQAADYQRYNCKDSANTLHLYLLFREGFPASVLPLVEEQHAQARAMLKMTYRGVLQRMGVRDQFAKKCYAQKRDLEKYLDAFTPVLVGDYPLVKGKSKTAWYSSPTQLSKVLYTLCGLPVQTNKKTRRPSTDDDALEALAQMEPLFSPILKRILALRSLGVFLSTFIYMEVDSDNRCRTSYGPGLTETFRCTSSKNAFDSGGNLQNIPGDKEKATTSYLSLPNIKECFIPDPGYEMGDFDLKGADAQVVAWEANDTSLKEFFKKNEGSIHDVNAEDLGVERHLAKIGCHLTNYVGSAFALSKAAGIAVTEAQAFQSRWFTLHPGIKEWHKQLWKLLNTTRTVRNRFGYYRTYLDRITEKLLPEAAAWIPQSTVGIITTKALIHLDTHYPWIIPLLQVHDSLVCQWPIARREEAIAAILEAFSISVPYEDPLEIPVNYKISRLSWGQCG